MILGCIFIHALINWSRRTWLACNTGAGRQDQNHSLYRNVNLSFAKGKLSSLTYKAISRIFTLSRILCPFRMVEIAYK